MSDEKCDDQKYDHHSALVRDARLAHDDELHEGLHLRNTQIGRSGLTLGDNLVQQQRSE
jgi:hypothetical protein